MSDFESRAQFISLFSDQEDPIGAALEFEDQVLSIGREFLPPAAIEMLDTNGSGSTEYWNFLISQLEKF